MISDNYKDYLLKEAKELDGLSKNELDFERLVNEITDIKNDTAILILLKNIGILSKKSSLDKIQKQKNFIELLYKYIGAAKVDELYETLKESSGVSLESLLGQLNELIGLKAVKQQVYSLIQFNQIQQLRVKNGLKKSNKTLHMAFLGNPGTAKTTVARIVGRMYKSIGLLSKGHFIEASRTDLIAEYQGQTAVKVKKLINRAKGGVLFIDEAYSITENDHSDSYGKECLTELTKALEDYRNDLVVIVAGYPELMKQFFKSNPGLKSRFNTFIVFDDYSLDELLGIFKFLCEKNDYIVKKAALDKVEKLLQEQLEYKDSHFSNGRFVRNLFDDITMNQAKRLSLQKSVIDKEGLMQLISEDVFNHNDVSLINRAN